MLNVSNDKMPNANVVSKSVNVLKIDANNPITIASNVPMINAEIKTKVGITHVKNDKIVILHQTDEITRLSSFSDLLLKKRPSRHPVKVFNKANVREVLF